MVKTMTQVVLSTFLLAFLCAHVSAQTQAAQANAQNQAAVDQSIKEIQITVARIREEEAARVRLLAETEKQAMDELSKITVVKQKAEVDLGKARADVAIARSHIKHGGAQSIDPDDFDVYERSVGMKAAAELEVSRYTTQAANAQAKLEISRRARELAEQEMSQMEITRAQQQNRLDSLYRAWRDSKTDENFKALTGNLTVMAETYAIITDVEVVSEDANKNQTDGARINYESWLDRQHNLQPIKATPCTTVKPPATPTCIIVNMPKGWYYIWAVRENGRITSDKNFFTHVDGMTPQITVREDH